MMPIAHDSSVTCISAQVGKLRQITGKLGFNSCRDQFLRSRSEQIRQRIRHPVSTRKINNVSRFHGRVSPSVGLLSHNNNSTRYAANLQTAQTPDSVIAPPQGDRLKRGSQHQAIGRSRGGLTTKIVALVDVLGNLVRFLLLPGQAHDMKGVAPLIKGVSFDALLADKAFDADWLLQDLDERGATAVIPPKTNRKIQRNYDAEVYKWRHLVENYFAKIKEFRGIATRYDKTDCSYAACWNLVAALIASR
jgi:transposase